jgi:hypothetical protein
MIRTEVGQTGGKFWIILAALVGYNVQYVWDLLRDWFIYRPEYPFTFFVLATSPGYLFFRSHLLVGLTNALVYGVAIWVIAKLRGIRVTSVQTRNRFLKWISLFGAAGLIVPTELLLRFAVFHSSITIFEWWLWPSAIFTMATEGSTRTAFIVEVAALSVGANVLLYAILGLLTWPLGYVMLRRKHPFA